MILLAWGPAGDSSATGHAHRLVHLKVCADDVRVERRKIVLRQPVSVPQLPAAVARLDYVGGVASRCAG